MPTPGVRHPDENGPVFRGVIPGHGTLDKQRLVRCLGIVTGATLRLTLGALREMFEK